MTQTRILVVAQPLSLRAAVHDAATGEADLEVIDAPGGEVEVLLQVAEEGADLVVVAMTARELPTLAERLLDEYPRLSVLAMDLDRAEGLLYGLQPSTTLIRDIPADGLNTVLRRAAIGRAS